MRVSQLLTGLGIVLVSSVPVMAVEEAGVRHGAVPSMAESIGVEAGTTITFQHASDARIADELLASLDVVSMIPTAQGQWLIYVEGNTSPRENGVSALLPEANQDAGSALDRDGHGQLQVSALHYLHYTRTGAVVGGLIDPAGPLDNSEIANDETRQFLASTLVNNPTIAFPDYALGMAYFYKPDQSHFEFTLLLSSSHGLADNPNHSYAELVDVTAPGKGVFTAGESAWRSGSTTWRIGVWLQTADNAYVDGSGNTANNYGVYLSTDHDFDGYRLNVRAGAANPTVSDAAQFLGFAVDHAFGKDHAGIGYTHTFVSGEAAPTRSDTSQFELYYSLNLAENYSITPSLQHIQNSGFDSSGVTSASDVNVFSVRASYAF